MFQYVRALQTINTVSKQYDNFLASLELFTVMFLTSVNERSVLVYNSISYTRYTIQGALARRHAIRVPPLRLRRYWDDAKRLKCARMKV